jgi:outer membrane protein assembly factor BamB
MTDQPAPKAFACPSCGSPLNFPSDGSRSVTCLYCNSSVIVPAADAQADEPVAHAEEVLAAVRGRLMAGRKAQAVKLYRQHFQVSLAEARKAVEAMALELPDPTFGADANVPWSAARAQAQPQRLVRRRSRPGILGWLIITSAIVGAFLIFFPDFLTDGKSNTGLFSFNQSPALTATPARRAPSLSDPVVLIAKDDALADVALQARRFDMEPNTTGLLRIDTATGSPLWETEPFNGKDAYIDTVITAADNVYAAVKSHLVAYGLRDGKTKWQVDLSDRLSSCQSPHTCIAVVDNVLIASTIDNTLQAIDAATGQPIWQYRVISPIGVIIHGQEVMAFNRTEAPYQNYFAFLDIKTGKEIKRVEQQGYFSLDLPLLDANHLYMVTGGVIEAWDISGDKAAIAWEKQYLKSNFQRNAILGQDGIYVGSTHGIVEIKLTDGTDRTLLSNEDYRFDPLKVDGNQLLVLATRSRGTSTQQLWGIDLASGEQTGPINLGDNRMVQPMGYEVVHTSQFVWTWALNGPNLSVIKFEAKPNQITIEPYDLKSGSGGKLLTVPLTQLKNSGSSYSIRKVIGIQQHVLWLMLDSQIFGVDFQTGKIVFSSK